VHSPPPPAIADTCPQGAPPMAVPPAVEAIAQSAQSLVRMKQLDQALATIAQLDAVAKDPAIAVAAHAMAAELYWPLDNDKLADAELAAAAHAAKTVDDKRLVEHTKAFGLENARRTGALAQLYQQWQRGEDPCLRAEGTRGIEQWAKVASAKQVNP
jgi:hypothetical protein